MLHFGNLIWICQFPCKFWKDAFLQSSIKEKRQGKKMTDLNTGIFHILKFKRMGDMFLGLERHNYFGELSSSMGNATQRGIPWEENKLEIKPSHLLQIKTTIGSIIVWSKKKTPGCPPQLDTGEWYLKSYFLWQCNRSNCNC